MKSIPTNYVKLLNELRQAFEREHPEKVEELKTKEQQRRQRNKDRVDSGQEG